MNVAVAAQTLSETVGRFLNKPSKWVSSIKLFAALTGIALEEKGFHALAEYVLQIDKWFDCMNAGWYHFCFVLFIRFRNSVVMLLIKILALLILFHWRKKWVTNIGNIYLTRVTLMNVPIHGLLTWYRLTALWLLLFFKDFSNRTSKRRVSRTALLMILVCNGWAPISPPIWLDGRNVLRHEESR